MDMLEKVPDAVKEVVKDISKPLIQQATKISSPKFSVGYNLMSLPYAKARYEAYNGFHANLSECITEQQATEYLHGYVDTQKEKRQENMQEMVIKSVGVGAGIGVALWLANLLFKLLGNSSKEK